jgi:hypothetical protein
MINEYGPPRHPSSEKKTRLSLARTARLAGIAALGLVAVTGSAALANSDQDSGHRNVTKQSSERPPSKDCPDDGGGSGGTGDPTEELPDPGDEYPDPGDEYPDPGEELPDPGEELPDPGEELPDPGDEYPDPGDEYPDPGNEYPDPGDEYPDPGDEYPDPGDEYPDPGDSDDEVPGLPPGLPSTGS